MDINKLLKDWNDPLGARTMGEAEDLIHALQVELAGKEFVIKELEKDVAFYKRYQAEKYKAKEGDTKHNQWIHEQNKKLNALLENMQADVRSYLIPDKTECNQAWLVSRLIWWLDGPEQRKAQKTA